MLAHVLRARRIRGDGIVPLCELVALDQIGHVVADSDDRERLQAALAPVVDQKSRSIEPAVDEGICVVLQIGGVDG
jgi:hypothetical protein